MMTSDKEADAHTMAVVERTPMVIVCLRAWRICSTSALRRSTNSPVFCLSKKPYESFNRMRTTNARASQPASEQASNVVRAYNVLSNHRREDALAQR